MRGMYRNAFTMLELIFVIVVIGILSAIAVPKLAATRDDALLTKARNTVASVRNAIATEHQKRILKGDFTTPISSVDSGSATSNDSPIFDRFDNNASANRVLEYPMRTCKSGSTEGCWLKTGGVYRYYFPHNNQYADFNVTNNRFDCISAQANCDLLE